MQPFVDLRTVWLGGEKIPGLPQKGAVQKLRYAVEVGGWSAKV